MHLNYFTVFLLSLSVWWWGGLSISWATAFQPTTVHNCIDFSSSTSLVFLGSQHVHFRGTQIFNDVIFFSQDVALDNHIHKYAVYHFWETHFFKILSPWSSLLTRLFSSRFCLTFLYGLAIHSLEQNHFFNVQHISCDNVFKNRSLSEELCTGQTSFARLSTKISAVTGKMIIWKEICVLQDGKYIWCV